MEYQGRCACIKEVSSLDLLKNISVFSRLKKLLNRFSEKTFPYAKIKRNLFNKLKENIDRRKPGTSDNRRELHV